MSRTLLLPLLALLLVSCDPVAQHASGRESPGCENINDPFYDRQYMAGSVFFSPFRAGESVRLEAGEPTALGDPSRLWVQVTDTAAEPDAVLFQQWLDLSRTVTYRFERGRTEVQIYWTVDAGAATWAVECQAETPP